jgi:hypothetical protein
MNKVEVYELVREIRVRDGGGRDVRGGRYVRINERGVALS